MLSSGRLAQLPTGVRELVSRSTRTQASHAARVGWRLRTGASVGGKSFAQRRGITINQLDDGKDGVY
jgi:hypothetical protein